MKEIKKDLLHTFVLSKEKFTNTAISRYDDEGYTDLEYIKEYWGETGEEIKAKWLRITSKHYLIIWSPTIIMFLILFFVIGKGEGNLLMTIYNILLAITLFAAIFATNVRTEKAKSIILSLRGRKERAKKKERERKKKERERKKIEELNDQYGEPYGECVYYGIVDKGMSIDAVLASWSSPKLKKNNIWYYPDENEQTLSLVSFKNKKVVHFSDGNKPFELNMSKKDVVSIWGKPEDEKETVFKTKTKLKLYYFPRTTRQDTTVYGYEVKLEDDIVVGWKDLE